MRLSTFSRLALCALCGATLFALLPASPSQAQQRWERTFGGSVQDYGYDVRQTSDGGYVVAGMTNSFGAGNYDVYVIKTDASGNGVWTRTYGGAGSDYGQSVQQTSDSGYVLAGNTASFGPGNTDVWLIKTNASGDTLWTRTFGGATRPDGAYSVQQTASGGYILAGFTQSYGPGTPTYANVWLILTDGSGNPFWTRFYGGNLHDGGYSGQQTLDGGFIIAGYTESYGQGSQDVYLIKTNSNGDTLWTRTYGGAGSDEGYSVQQTRDTGYIVAGSTNSYGAGNQDVYLIKTNANGDTLWTRTYGGAENDIGNSVQQTQDGGYILTGQTRSFGRYYQVYLIKTNASGDTLWTRTFGGDSLDQGSSVRQTQDGGYIIAGITDPPGGSRGDYDVYLIKTDGNGSSGIETERGRGFKG